MCGSATLAIVVSRICMIIAPMMPTVSRPRFLTGSEAWPGTGSGTTVLRVDRDVGAEASDHRARRRAVDRDAHRNALRDLHPVAIGILRREDGEFGTGAGA